MQPGTRLGPYEVTAPIGAGGMGEVYRARDTRLGRDVAIKVLPAEFAADPERLRRFEREAKATAALSHPNILDVHDVGTVEDVPYLVEELLEGESLRDRLARGPVSVGEAVEIAVQVAHGLAAAHGKHIVHRDLKPANVFITTEGIVKILDFGIAKLVESVSLGEVDTLTHAPTGATEFGQLLGTMAYMSPEQARGMPVDPRSDIFSFGVVLYEMVAAEQPFQGETATDVVAAILKEEPPPLPARVPHGLAALIGRCLAKEPGQRFANGGELEAALKTVQAEGAGPLWGILRHAVRRRSWLVAANVVVTLAVVLLVLNPGGLRKRFLPGAAARKTLQKWLKIPVVPEQLHIAVLGFTNVGGDPANRAFCDGATEILSSTLTKLENFRDRLWVVPASEVRAREVKSAGEARGVFGVNLAVTGSVFRAGDKVRLTVNLVDAETLRQISSELIEAPEADLPELQDRVASVTLEMVKVELDPAQRTQFTTGGTKVSKAYDFYVQGRGTLENYQGESDPERAAELFKQAIALDSGYALAYAGLAQANLESYRKKKDARQVDEAVTSARRAVELDDRLGEVHATLGSLYTTTGKYEDAVREFKRGIELQPRNASTFSGLARAYDALGNAAGAEETYRRAVALRPEYWLGYTELGAFYYRRGRYEDAEKQFQKAVALTPQNAWAYNNLGAVYLVRAQNSQAREMFERSVAIKPLYGALSNLGTLYFKEGKFRESATMYEKALAIRGTDFRLWGNLGTAYGASGQKPKAKEAFAQAVKVAEQQRKVNPRDTRLLIDLAGYYGQLGERAKGLALLELVLKAPPTDADSMEKIGESFNDLGERERAIEWIGKALKAGFPVATLEEGPALRDLRNDPRFRKLVEESSKGR